MIDIVKDKCVGCFACQSKCPTGCIELKPNKEGFLYPLIDYDKCIECGACNSVCPVLNVKKEEQKNIKTYAAYVKGEKLRLKSSSGGIFTAIAEKVIENGGIVFGAAFDERFNVMHKYVEAKEELACFRGSKYVQSSIGETYKQAKDFLENGRQVLFTGTPCQIGGLFSYLKKDYENLLTQDFICHGVPSPLVWRKYVEHREQVAGANARNITFRGKEKGWKTFSMEFGFNNNTEYTSDLFTDLFIKAFLNNLCLRESCYNCGFKTKYRRSDITLADFWGVEKILPEMDDDKGTSLVLLNSLKGREVFNKISDKLEYAEADFDKAIEYNSAIIKSVTRPIARDFFIKNVKAKRFDKAIIASDKKTEKINRIAVFKSDIATITREKGKIFSMLYRLKHFWKVYF